MMDAIFSDMIDDNLVIICMDDILIFVPDKLICAKNTKKVLAQLQEKMQVQSDKGWLPRHGYRGREDLYGFR